MDHKRHASTYPPELLPPKKRPVLRDITNTNTKPAVTVIGNHHLPSRYNHLHALEMDANKRPLANYLESVQRDVSSKMREILVDWLGEVADQYRLSSDTLFLAVSFLDRFLSIRPINRTQLQLLAVSSLLIASKHEEITPPQPQDMCYITDNSYTLPEILQMEKEILATFNSDLTYPTAKTFLRIFITTAQNNFQHSKVQLEFLASYLLELCLLDYKCLKFLPSLTAASALFLSRFIMEPYNHPWNLDLQCQTGYKLCHLKECILAIHALHSTIAESPLQGTRQKYSKLRFTGVATLTAGEIPATYLESIDENQPPVNWIQLSTAATLGTHHFN